MKFARILLVGLLVVSHAVSSTSNHGAYYGELKAFKKSPSTKELFDKDAHPELIAIQRDIATYKVLTPMQRLAQFILLSFDVVVVTPDSFPLLYACVDTICQKGNVIMPVVFVTRKKGFLNAFALKLLKSNGGIVIGQDLLSKVSDESLEAIIAHEIGHIKHNHNNKLLVLNLSLSVAVGVISQYLKPGLLSVPSRPIQFSDVEICRFVRELVTLDLKLDVMFFISSVIAAFIINKQYEKEADEFTCKTVGKSAGLIELFEYYLKKEQLREDEFIATYDILQQNKAVLPNDYNELAMRYYLAKAGHVIEKAYKYIYHNTFLGAHPSHEARITAAKKYLATQEA